MRNGAGMSHRSPPCIIAEADGRNTALPTTMANQRWRRGTSDTLRAAAQQQNRRAVPRIVSKAPVMSIRKAKERPEWPCASKKADSRRTAAVAGKILQRKITPATPTPTRRNCGVGDWRQSESGSSTDGTGPELKSLPQTPDDLRSGQFQARTQVSPGCRSATRHHSHDYRN